MTGPKSAWEGRFLNWWSVNIGEEGKYDHIWLTLFEVSKKK